MKLDVWDEDKHLQVNDYHADSMDAFHTFWKELQDKYTGYSIDFCFHNGAVPVDYMSEINAEVMESCIETRLSQERLAPVAQAVTLVTTENFAAFAALHDRANPASSGMYWTSERISRDISRWCIYLCGNSYIMMSLWGNESEIFALETTDKRAGESLLSSAAAYAFKAGKTGVLYMVNDDAPTELAMAQTVGFVPCGKYIAYHTMVN